MKTTTLAVLLLVLAGCGSRDAAPSSRHVAEHDFSEANVCSTCAAVADSACCDSAAMAACCPDDSTGIAGADTCPTPASLSGPDGGAVVAAPARRADSAALPRLWEFGRGTCKPCKAMKAILDPLATEYAGKVDVRIINIDDEPGLTKQFRIMTIPTQVFIGAAGDELFRHIGFYPRDSIVAKFTELGFGACTGGS